MDILNIDFKSLIPTLVQAYTKVYGDEYQDLIEEKINKAYFFEYNNYLSLNNYVFNLKKVMARKYVIRFLKMFNIDIPPFSDYYSLNEDDIKAIKGIFNNALDAFLFLRNDIPLDAFKKGVELNDKTINLRLQLINYLKSDNKELTKEEFLEFMNSSEYASLVKKINEFYQVYQSLLKEYQEWLKSLEKIEKYIKSENKRMNDILAQATDEYVEKIMFLLPEALKQKGKDEVKNILFDETDISYDCDLDFFKSETLEEVRTLSASEDSIEYILLNHYHYLLSLGVEIPEELLTIKNLDDVNRYFAFLDREDIKKLIPSEENANYFSFLKGVLNKEAFNKFYLNKPEVKKYIKQNRKVTEVEINYLCKLLKSEDICVLYGSEDGKTIPILLYTINNNSFGVLSYTLLHEVGHIIDFSPYGSGFDYNDSPVSSYNKAFRRYEKFNETFNDIFCIEALNYLQENGIFLIEPEDLAIKDLSNRNSSHLTKKILYPLIAKYREQVVKAKITNNKIELTNYIGEDNYENLVDCLNKIDDLTRKGLESRLNRGINDEIVKEYYEALDDVKQIYANIDIYYNSKGVKK